MINSDQSGWRTGAGRSLLLVSGAVLVASLLVVSCTSARSVRMPDSPQGERLYRMHCAACHGDYGRGDGPGAIALDVLPRDFRKESFRYISTMIGVPTADDLVQTIREGRRYGEMPSGPQLSDAEVHVLADYVKEMHRLGWVDRLQSEFAEEEELTPEEIDDISREKVEGGAPIRVAPPGPGFKPDSDEGRKLYLESCAACHGPAGRGDGLEKPKDEQGRTIRVRDLTTGEFRGGSSPQEVFKRIRCGVPGTPMPAQPQWTDDQIWQLVHYTRLLAGGWK